jgi:hypothetical protein
VTRSLGSRFSAAFGRPTPSVEVRPTSDEPLVEPLPALPRQRSVGFDDLLAEGTALLGVHRNARRG